MRGYYDMLVDARRTRRGRQDEAVRHLLHARRAARRATARVHLSRRRARRHPGSGGRFFDTENRCSPSEKSSTDHRWRLPRKSGPGGWAAILRYNEHKKEIWGFEKHTTNNRMELIAAIEGLRALQEGCEVEVVTDSEYLKNGITTVDSRLEAEKLDERPGRSRSTTGSLEGTRSGSLPAQNHMVVDQGARQPRGQ